MTKHEKRTASLPVLTLDGPVALHLQLSERANEKIDRDVRNSMQKMFSQAVDKLFQGQATAVEDARRQMQLAFSPKVAQMLLKNVPSMPGVGRITVRPGDSFPVSVLGRMVVADVQVVDSLVQRIVPHAGMRRPPRLAQKGKPDASR